MIRQIKELLQDRGRLTLSELSIHFGMDPAALEPVLKLLVDKEQVMVTLVGCPGKTCNGCSCTSLAAMMVYERAAPHLVLEVTH